MLQTHDDSTSSSLLRRVASLSNQPAWSEFVRYYDPRLRRWCRRFALDADLADELCQRVWILLMRKLPSLRYDPTRSFRGWLWFRFRSQALTLIKERRGEVARLVDTAFLDQRASAVDEFDDEPNERLIQLLRSVENIHENVRGRVKPHRWEAYWRIVVRDEDVAETAALLGMSYAAAYVAARYVDRMVRAEGQKRTDGTSLHV